MSQVQAPLSVKGQAVIRCRDAATVRACLTTLRILKIQGGILDCSGTTWIDPGFMVLLHHILSVERKSAAIALPGLPKAREYMLKHLESAKASNGAQVLSLRQPTDFPLRRVSGELAVTKEIGKWREMLVECGVSDREARSFGAIVSEVLQNSFQHAGTLPQPPIIAGQTFAKQAHSTLVVVDQGNTIPVSLRQSGRFPANQNSTDDDWIELALQEGVTAMSRPTNRGIGLYHLRKKVEENGGSLCVLSGNGIVEVSQSRLKKQVFGHKHFPRFPGTLLILDIKK